MRPIDGTLTGTTVPGQNEPRIKGNEEVRYILHCFMIGALLRWFIVIYRLLVECFFFTFLLSSILQHQPTGVSHFDNMISWIKKKIPLE